MGKTSQYGAMVTVAAVVGALLTGAAPTTAAEQLGHDQLVAPVPAESTPDIANGYPQAIVKIGDRVVVGGTFDEVVDRSTGQRHPRPYLFAFHADTGLVDPGFAPSLSNEVTSLLPGPFPDTVYVGGRMNHVNGQSGYSKLVLLDLTDGSLVTSFSPPPMNGAVMAVREAGGKLLVGGFFTTVGGVPHGGLVTLDPLTGARLPYLDIHLTEHHNYDGSGAKAAVGASALDVTPDGALAVVIGNFKLANGLDRDQALMLDLTGPEAAIRDWHTTHYQPACTRNAFDKWVRDVSFSPDGSYFVIVSTGGPWRNTLCDTAARWETAATGSDLHPTWVNWSGGDTILSVGITETAVYVGGHQRWMNNHLGRDAAATGAVGRPGLAALDPVSGVPYSWNPGRHPRGYGATVIYPTPDGLYVGSDTDFIGNFRYRREKIAFFPVAGGETPPAGASATLPGELYFTDVPVEFGLGVPDILHRINVGGEQLAAIDDGPDWLADLDESSPYRNEGSARVSYGPDIPVDASVPATTPTGVFNSRRWDLPGDPDLTWSFPVPEGIAVEVRIYLAERTWESSSPGSRVFDVFIDDTLVADDLDVAAEVGYKLGTTLAVPVVSDGAVDIRFGREVGDPSLLGIEIVRAEDAEPGTAPGIVSRAYDGTDLGAAVPVGGADGTAWDQLRGVFLVDDHLFYGMSDGTFWRRAFDGTVLGPPEQLRPHSDPNWDGVGTSSGRSTYSGVPTSFATAIQSMRSMHFADGRIFYTRAGQNRLYWRWFNPENGLASSREFTIPGSGSAASLNNLSNTSGLLFLSDGYVYWVRAADGQLVRRPLVDHGPGSEQVTTSSSASRTLAWDPAPAEAVSGPDLDGIDWRTPGAFLGALTSEYGG